MIKDENGVTITEEMAKEKGYATLRHYILAMTNPDQCATCWHYEGFHYEGGCSECDHPTDPRSARLRPRHCDGFAVRCLVCDHPESYHGESGCEYPQAHIDYVNGRRVEAFNHCRHHCESFFKPANRLKGNETARADHIRKAESER